MLGPLDSFMEKLEYIKRKWELIRQARYALRKRVFRNEKAKASLTMVAGRPSGPLSRLKYPAGVREYILTTLVLM